MHGKGHMMMMSELDKLEQYLKEKHYNYKRIDQDEVITEDGHTDKTMRHQLIVYAGDIVLWDAICHKGSYGYEQGLLEVMGNPVVLPYDGDSVVGFLTAQDVIDRLERKL